VRAIGGVCCLWFLLCQPLRHHTRSWGLRAKSGLPRAAGPARHSRYRYVAQEAIAVRGYDIWGMVLSAKVGFTCGRVFLQIVAVVVRGQSGNLISNLTTAVYMHH